MKTNPKITTVYACGFSIILHVYVITGPQKGHHRISHSGAKKTQKPKSNKPNSRDSSEQSSSRNDYLFHELLHFWCGNYFIENFIILSYAVNVLLSPLFPPEIHHTVDYIISHKVMIC